MVNLSQHLAQPSGSTETQTRWDRIEVNDIIPNALMTYLLCTGHHPGHMREVLLTPLLRWKGLGLDKFGHLPKVTCYPIPKVKFFLSSHTEIKSSDTTLSGLAGLPRRAAAVEYCALLLFFDFLFYQKSKPPSMGKQHKGMATISQQACILSGLWDEGGAGCLGW